MIKLATGVYVAAHQVETIAVDGENWDVVVITISGKEFRLPNRDHAQAANRADEIARQIGAA